MRNVSPYAWIIEIFNKKDPKRTRLSQNWFCNLELFFRKMELENDKSENMIWHEQQLSRSVELYIPVGLTLNFHEH